MSGILRTALSRAAPALRVGNVSVRGIKSLPPKTPLSTMEKTVGLTAISLGCLVIPGYIMANLDSYKARED